MATDEEMRLARVAGRGTFHLLAGKVIGRAIGLLGGVILVRLLETPEEYGILNLALIPIGVFMLFSDLGVDGAVTRYFARFKSSGREAEIRPFLVSSLLIKTAMSFLLAGIAWVLSGFLAGYVIGKPYVADLVRLASLLIIGWSFDSFFMAILVALDVTKPYAGFMIVSETIQAILPILLVVSGMGVDGALLGMVSAWLVVSSIGTVFAARTALRGSSGRSAYNLRSATKEIFSFGIPLSASYLLEQLQFKVTAFMMAAYVIDAVIGEYTVASNLNATITYLAWPVSSIMLPTFSKMNYQKESSSLKKSYKYFLRYSSLIVVPCGVLMTILARPLVILLFGDQYKSAWLLLFLLSLKWVKYGLGGTHMVRFLQAQGETRYLAGVQAVGTCVTIVSSLVLIPLFGIFGLIATSYIGDVPLLVLWFQRVIRKYGLKPPLGDLKRLYASVVLMSVAVAPILLLEIDIILQLLAGLLIAAIVFLLAVAWTMTLNETDIGYLREIVRPQPLLNRVVSKILDVLEFLIAHLRKSKNLQS